MLHLTLNDLFLALPDLLDRRASALDGLLAAQLYIPSLERLREQLIALPIGDQAPDRFVEELSEADTRHDALASALNYFVKAYLRLPDLEEAHREQLLSLEPLIPDLSDGRASYASQAATAIERFEGATETQLEALRQLPLVGDRTLADVFESYVESGRQLDSLLRSRANAQLAAAPSRAQAGILRNQIIGTLGSLRDAIVIELQTEPERAATLDRETFAYLDLLHTNRAENRRDNTVPVPPPPAEDDGPVGTSDEPSDT